MKRLYVAGEATMTVHISDNLRAGKLDMQSFWPKLKDVFAAQQFSHSPIYLQMYYCHWQSVVWLKGTIISISYKSNLLANK